MNAISINYTEKELRILVEEFIAMQRSEFTFKGVCSYILYRAMEEGRTAGIKFYESNELYADDRVRVSNILKKIVKEGRVSAANDHYIDETVFVKK